MDGNINKYPFFHAFPGKWLSLPSVLMFHGTTAGGHLWSTGGVRLDSFLSGHHSPPWVWGLPGHGGGYHRWLIYWLGEKEHGDAQPYWWSGRSKNPQAAEREWGTGQKKRERKLLFLIFLFKQEIVHLVQWHCCNSSQTLTHLLLALVLVSSILLFISSLSCSYNVFLLSVQCGFYCGTNTVF